MKKIVFSILTISTILMATPAINGGITYKFGSDFSLENAGATLKVLSTSEDKKPVLGAGVSFYPWAAEDNKLGIDVSAGYNFKSGSVMGGWDFLQNEPSVSLGYNKEVDIKSTSKYDDTIQDARCDKDK